MQAIFILNFKYIRAPARVIHSAKGFSFLTIAVKEQMWSQASLEKGSEIRENSLYLWLNSTFRGDIVTRKQINVLSTVYKAHVAMFSTVKASLDAWHDFYNISWSLSTTHFSNVLFIAGNALIYQKELRLFILNFPGSLIKIVLPANKFQFRARIKLSW